MHARQTFLTYILDTSTGIGRITRKRRPTAYHMYCSIEKNDKTGGSNNSYRAMDLRTSDRTARCRVRRRRTCKGCNESRRQGREWRYGGRTGGDILILPPERILVWLVSVSELLPPISARHSNSQHDPRPTKSPRRGHASFHASPRRERSVQVRRWRRRSSSA